jgi:hypothetical protein
LIIRKLSWATEMIIKIFFCQWHFHYYTLYRFTFTYMNFLVQIQRLCYLNADFAYRFYGF